jgi:periplasmic protein CpxP/Spy
MEGRIMNYFKEKKFAFWAIIVLVLLNITTLTMVWLHKPPRPELQELQRRRFIPEFIVKELKLDEKQAIAFDMAEKTQKVKINLLTDSIRNLKKDLFTQCFDQPEDTARITEICNKIGEIAIKIDASTYTHITKLKAICNAEQQQLLKDFIMDMASVERRHPENDAPPRP